jgi:uncharacterized protein
MKNRLEFTFKPAAELVELEPYGVTAGADHSRPVMLFKEIGGEEMLPVWLNPIDASIAVSQHQVASPGLSPHELSLKVIENLGVTLASCVFTEIRGHHQFVELKFEGSRRLKSLSARADQAISFCLQAKTRFFCTRAYIQDSKVLTADMATAQNELRMNPGKAKNRHPYLN